MTKLYVINLMKVMKFNNLSDNVNLTFINIRYLKIFDDISFLLYNLSTSCTIFIMLTMERTWLILTVEISENSYYLQRL